MDVLYLRAAPPKPCADGAVLERIDCLTEARYAGDAEAAAIAKALFASTGTLAGVYPEEKMDGGFRGMLRLVPELPVGTFRQKLAWVADALRDVEAVFAAVKTRAGTEPRYRWRELELRFFRSVGRTTPSAFAIDWTIGFNVSGSLHTGPDAVRETMFHEIFHLNDAARGDWSPKRLGRDYEAIVAKCGRDVRCLTPYAPGTTKVRGGTFYAFQPDNGLPVREYAAELALRWYREHRALTRGEGRLGTPFKCGPPENARAWKAIVEDFFRVDLVPACDGK